MDNTSIPFSALSPEEQERRRAKQREYEARRPRPRLRPRQPKKYIPRSQLSVEDRIRLRSYDQQWKSQKRIPRAQLPLKEQERLRARDKRARARDKARHPEAAAQATARYRARHPERVQASRRRAIEVNPERHLAQQRARCARRRAHKRQAPINDFTVVQWRGLCKAVGYRCAYCDKKFPFKQLTPDHITPLSKGGSHTLRNIIPSCLPCNLRKYNGNVPKATQPFLLLAEDAAD